MFLSKDEYPQLVYNEDRDIVFNGEIYERLPRTNSYGFLNKEPMIFRKGSIGIKTTIHSIGMIDFGEIVCFLIYTNIECVYFKKGFVFPDCDNDEIEKVVISDMHYDNNPKNNMIVKQFNESLYLNDMIDCETALVEGNEWINRSCSAYITFKNYKEIMLSDLWIYEYKDEIYLEIRDATPHNRSYNPYNKYKVRDEYQELFKSAINEYRTAYPENTDSN